MDWHPAHTPPVHSGNYWQQLAQLVMQSRRVPPPGLPIVTTRSDTPIVESQR